MIKSYFGKNEIYYFESDETRKLYKVGNKTIDDIIINTDGKPIYFTIVGDNLINRLKPLGIIDVDKNDIRQGQIIDESSSSESIFLGGSSSRLTGGSSSHLMGGSSSRLTGGSVFDDVREFLVWFNISSMEKLPSIVKGKNTYLFSF